MIDKQRFTMLPEHLTLLRNMSVGWYRSEFGAPCVDPKRPYGNGDVVKDMADILCVEPIETDDGPAHPPGTRERMTELHKQTQTALQIVLATGRFEEGVYECDECKRNWRKVG